VKTSQSSYRKSLLESKIEGRENIGIVNLEKFIEKEPVKINKLPVSEDHPDYEIVKRVYKRRELLPKVDLKQIPVQEAIQILKDKKDEIFDPKFKEMAMELSRMINNIDEKQLIHYVRDEIQKKDTLRE
jgi:hypothetical protein